MSSSSKNNKKKIIKKFKIPVDKYQKNVYDITVAADATDNKKCVRLAQLDRAFGYGPKGREFESSNAR